MNRQSGVRKQPGGRQCADTGWSVAGWSAIRWRAALGSLPVAACAVLALAGCSTAGTAEVGTTAPTSGTATAVAESVRRAIDAFNATAGGPVAAQQAELARLVSPGQRSVQSRCPVATTTLRFEPVYARLAPAPDWLPASGSLSGEVYALPTLIRIYTGDRMTGTDLTDLHVAVQSGQVLLPALCPS